MAKSLGSFDVCGYLLYHTIWEHFVVVDTGGRDGLAVEENPKKKFMLNYAYLAYYGFFFSIHGRIKYAAKCNAAILVYI